VLRLRFLLRLFPRVLRYSIEERRYAGSQQQRNPGIVWYVIFLVCSSRPSALLSPIQTFQASTSRAYRTATPADWSKACHFFNMDHCKDARSIDTSNSQRYTLCAPDSTVAFPGPVVAIDGRVV
jgi:hypothetical protein